MSKDYQYDADQYDAAVEQVVEDMTEQCQLSMTITLYDDSGSKQREIATLNDFELNNYDEIWARPAVQDALQDWVVKNHLGRVLAKIIPDNMMDDVWEEQNGRK